MDTKTYHFEKLAEKFDELTNAECYYYKEAAFLLAEYAEEWTVPVQEQALEFLKRHNMDFLLISRS
ncbi:MAG: hypothetical protein NC489_39385, partial [Ruminococcus flavefaciens]|nr:hypothetical protein [Ruminococcus flavefaciens]